METTLKLTASEKAVIDTKNSNKDIKILHICRAVGGWLLISFEKLDVPSRPRKKHTPPFKYIREMYGKRGARLQRWAGNIWDEESSDILDDWTVSKSSHLNGYRRSYEPH